MNEMVFSSPLISQFPGEHSLRPPTTVCGYLCEIQRREEILQD